MKKPQKIGINVVARKLSPEECQALTDETLTNVQKLELAFRRKTEAEAKEKAKEKARRKAIKDKK